MPFPSAHESIEERRINRATDFALHRIAEHQGDLLTLMTKTGMTNAAHAGFGTDKLLDVLPAYVTACIEPATGVPAEVVAPRIESSLRHMADLAAADRIALTDAMGAIEQLIVGGRIDLFSR